MPAYIPHLDISNLDISIPFMFLTLRRSPTKIKDIQCSYLPHVLSNKYLGYMSVLLVVYPFNRHQRHSLAHSRYNDRANYGFDV